MGWFSKAIDKISGKKNFDKAMKIVLGFEGGISDHSADRGGVTNYGVTQKRYNMWLVSRGLPIASVKKISPAEVESIYYEYWIEIKGYKLPLKAAVAVFDMAINSGSERANRYWKMTGKNLKNFFSLREKYYQSLVANDPSQRVFLKGWLNRLKHLEESLSKLDEE
jgi:hypothetical protein